MVALLLFPALQAVLFGFSCALCAEHAPIAVGLIGIAAILLCFSVHVSIHEAVHHPDLARFPFAGPLLSLVMGLPFQGYRWHHANHHRCNNTLADYSSTWRSTPQGPRPWPLWRYVFGWPRQLARSGFAMRAAAARGEMPRSTQRAIRAEQITLLVAIAGLVVFAPRMALLYLGLVYAGWALIALQNYGQHPPREYGADVPTTYASRLYNRLFFRNGLHAEHHDQPHLAWKEIEARSRTRIGAPHLMQPFLERGAR
jgi:fatty acid desaturase